MAFASVISLMNTIDRLLNSSHISLVPPSLEIIGSAYKEMKSLQEILKRLDGSSKSSSRNKVNALDAQIREVVSEFEDVLESHLSNQFLSQSEESINGDETHHPLLFSIDLLDLEQYVHFFTKKVMDLNEEYIKVLDNPLPEEEEEEVVSSRIDFAGKRSKLVGLSNLLSNIRDLLTMELEWRFGVVSLVGMAGIGKTTVAKEVFQDPLVLSYYNCLVWVTVSRKRQSNEIARDILAQVDPNMDNILMEGDEKIAQYLYESLKSKRYLIGLDVVWDKQVWNHLISSLPRNDGRSRVFLTTRLQEVADNGMDPSIAVLNMRLLNEKESWDLFREKVFGEEFFPTQLEKAGKKIAENCEGLPLMIVTVADILSKAEKTSEYWNKVAADKENLVFRDAYGEISKVLSPSYEYLPQHLKTCCLHMGVFPQDYNIPLSQLINMWIAEGFLEPNITQTLEDCAMECLGELVSNYFFIFPQKSTIWFPKLGSRIKTCRLHSSWWHLCNKLARKNKFFHVLNSHKDGLEEGIKSQRRLCIHNNILFAIKDMHNLIESDCASTARSLLCFGLYHPYPVPICFSLKLLRILDALTIHFYEFPMEVLKLIHLRYLSLTYNGKLPASIFKLWNLQFLIIHQHLSIKSCRAPSYVPLEIWDMHELKHIQIMGSNIPNCNSGISLENVVTLLGVSAHSCTQGVFKRIPNLKKLGIQIQLAPDDDSQPWSCLDHISHLNKLELLKCVIVNPELGSEIVTPPAPLSVFSSSLRKLSLSGLHYPWEYMTIIASLSNLEVLKLRCYAFRGPNWETKRNEFSRLEFLLIEDTDLTQLKVGPESFQMIQSLEIKHCYKLEKLHWESERIPQKLEIVDCDPLVVTCANEIISRRHGTRVYVHSSWDDANRKR